MKIGHHCRNGEIRVHILEHSLNEVYYYPDNCFTLSDVTVVPGNVKNKIKQ